MLIPILKAKGAGLQGLRNVMEVPALAGVSSFVNHISHQLFETIYCDLHDFRISPGETVITLET